MLLCNLRFNQVEILAN